MSDITQQSILIIGAGNMGKSIASGLINNGWRADKIEFCDKQESHHPELDKLFPQCNVIASPDELSFAPQVVLLAVKPQHMKALCLSLRSHEYFQESLFITVAAGLPIRAYQSWLHKDIKIVRCMPNTPAAIGVAMTGLYTAPNTAQADKNIAAQILNSIGAILWVDKESLLDAVTALSGSGPAYVFYLAECMQKSGQQLGLTASQSYTLTLQTLLGAAQLAAHEGLNFSDLRANVTSKGGTTEQAINYFMQQDLNTIINDALKAAATRAKEISQQFDKE